MAAYETSSAGRRAEWRGWRRRGRTEGSPIIAGRGAGDRRHGRVAGSGGGRALSPERPGRAEDKIEACCGMVNRSLE
ncbi:hypothetical protein NDU88_006172 [Pleurodeles waltl]|uniref:Uncharacterized protein n=1 Tax=Pleurodeles waltl TaxID=8319 RepID=A0AAV7MDC0_PLEWA|nr:hypothetical protein NDU88_006172 [Pleurodeles waltl]